METITIKVKNNTIAQKVIATLQNLNLDLKVERNKTTPKNLVPKSVFLKDLQEALQEVADIKKGKKKGKTVAEFLEYVK